MASAEHIEILRHGIDAWNQWRTDHPDVVPDLRGVSRSDLLGVDLSKADFSRAQLRGARLSGVPLRGTVFWKADLAEADLSGADLRQANLRKANLFDAMLTGADLRGANLTGALLVDTNLQRADLRGSLIYGCSVWSDKPEVKGARQLEGAKQSDLLIVNAPGSHNWEPERGSSLPLRVDNLRLAQLIHLLLDNETIREVIDLATTKIVLILGRFTPERKVVLEALREELRDRHNYVPVLCDFEMSDRRDITETVTLLARLARFIVADLTEPSSIPKELEALVPTVAVPVQPILEGSRRPYSMFKDYWKYDWVLAEHRYESLDGLRASLPEAVIEPAEAKAKELAVRRTQAMRSRSA